MSVTRGRGISGLIDDVDARRSDGIGRECLKGSQLAPVLGEGINRATHVQTGVAAHVEWHSARVPDVLPDPRGVKGEQCLQAVAARADLAPSLRPELRPRTCPAVRRIEGDPHVIATIK